MSYLYQIFNDKELIVKINKRLPYLFQLAEIECSRSGKVGMEVGSLREKIIIALLIYKFGESNVDIEIPITEKEVDVKLFNNPISIKTITGNKFSGVKLSWTVDAQSSKGFLESYEPISDMLLIQINWYGYSGFYFIPLIVQKRVLTDIGKSNYIKLPKQGTNPRGVEITKDALLRLVNDEESKNINIKWLKTEISVNPYKRWIDLWKDE